MQKIGKKSKAQGVKRISGAVTQAKNPSTGHWIVRNVRDGRFIAGTDGEPFDNIKISGFAQPAPNPSISKETALLAEEAVLEFLNENSINQ